MSTLSALKLVAAKRPNGAVPIVQRRNRLIAKIWEQAELAKAIQAGQSYAPVHTRKVIDPETGEKRSAVVPKRVKPWWFTAESGKLCLTVKYGAKHLELAKGKSAVEVGAMSDLVAVLDTLKAAVQAGELDAQIEIASGSLREGFLKK